MAKSAKKGPESEDSITRKSDAAQAKSSKKNGSSASTKAVDSDVATKAKEADAELKTETASGVSNEFEELTAHYPEWAREFARKYFTKTFTQFILHGNVRDLVPSADEKGTDIYVPLRSFLTDDLFGSRDIIVFYDRSSGIHFVDQASQKDFNRALSGYDTIFGTDYAGKLPKDPVRVLSILENYFRLRLADGKRIACIIDYADTIVPMAEASTYSSEDRNTLVFLAKWSHDPLFMKSDFTVALITENLTNLNQALVQSPYTAELQIKMPNEKERLRFVDWYLTDREPTYAERAEVSKAALAQNTAGLGYIQLRTILADVLENRTQLSFETLSMMKKEFIEAEAYGMLEFVETDYTLDMVAGHKHAIKHLRQAAKALKDGHPQVMPMGYLVSGPVGTGKTFTITCFAGEIGIPMVKLKNFRSQWQGQTEGNLEKILNLFEAMTPVAVMIDEADAALGDRSSSGDSGVSSRVFGQIASFMSNTKHRGRIIFFLVTARPDLMPIDLKRQGRAEEHIALFYPSTQDEREELLRVMMKKTKTKFSIDLLPASMTNGEKSLSGADMEALLTRAQFRIIADGEVSKELLQEVVDDFIPPTYPLAVELQNLAAVLECTSIALLPEEYQSMNREAIVRRVAELKLLVR